MIVSKIFADRKKKISQTDSDKNSAESEICKI